MVNSFQFTREVRLRLTHQRPRRQKERTQRKPSASSFLGFFVDLVADDDQAGRRQVDWSHCNSAWHSTASGSVQVEPRVGRGGEARQDAIAVF